MAIAEKALSDEKPSQQTITVGVWRGDATGGREELYDVPITPGMVVLDAIHYIQAHYAPDLGVRWNCKAGKCGSCSAEVNGWPRLMCKTRLDTWIGQVVHVQPMKSFPVIKDLVTDVDWNYEIAKRIPPFQTDQKPPFIMYQRDVERPQEFRKCIECFLCQDVCHVIREHSGKSKYYGPRFMIKVAEWEMHPMDTGDRLDFVDGEAGIGYCNVNKCCEEVCPEHIKITDNAIIPLKERVADRKWDPIRNFIWRRHENKKKGA